MRPDCKMNLEIKGVAASPRGQTRVTSKSDLAKGWRAQSHASETRPQEVPSLDLGKLGDSDDEDTYVPLSKEYPRFGPPDSSSTVSWGTPLHTPYAQHDQKPQISLTQLKTVPENLPSASDRFRLKYQQYEEDMKNSYKQYTMREKNKQQSAGQDNRHEQGGRPEDGGFAMITPFDDKVYLQRCYTSKPYTAQHSLRKLEAEDLAAERRKQSVVEQVMIDHLSRAVISDPEQNVNASFLNNPQQDLTSAPLRFRKRTLHETKIKTSSTLTENMLSNKLRFDARIICRNGRDACRELIGFFFTHDKSVTIYEYRQFGKNRTNALPFIQKGIYLHKSGRRRGKPYEIKDFFPGADLSFLTAEHQSLSESLRQNPILTIRITAIDEEALKSLRDICEGNKLDLGVHWNDEENIILAMQDVMKEKLKKRGVRTLTGLGKYLRQLDGSGSGGLGKAEFKQALQMYHLDISEKIFESFWLILDENNKGRVDCGIFVRALIGEMNEHRKSFVRKAFMKLDPNKTGLVTMVDIRKFYCAKKHPQVLAGSSSEEEIKSAFLETLENACSNPHEVSYCEFEDYYEGLSIGIMSDEDFVNILRNSWGI
ncbi:calcyphosin-2 isoform X1 [Bufo gargarizans]|uniref:calcyphosin-2 isoform X1 n=3 Tax=Bufo gargarizans TaxID=30331 RepID=UPI001CF2C2AA|nr:calcyphosin-2 isoform X1 [Bufo gargarizans]